MRKNRDQNTSPAKTLSKEKKKSTKRKGLSAMGLLTLIAGSPYSLLLLLSNHGKEL